MSASLSHLVPELQPFARDLLKVCSQSQLNPRVTSTLRSHAEQLRLYRRYLSGLQPLPVAVPGTSAHEFGYAFDMIVSPMEALSDVGTLWESWGGVWGGRFKDPVHFELPGFSPPPAIAEENSLMATIDRIADNPLVSVGSLLLPAATSFRVNTPEQDAALRSVAPQFLLDFFDALK